MKKQNEKVQKFLMEPKKYYGDEQKSKAEFVNKLIT